MISTTAWVRQGVPCEDPKKFQMNDEEYERICKLAKMQISDAQNDLESAQQKEADDLINDPELAEYNLDEYDNEEDGDEDTALFNVLGNGLAVFEDNEDDPYITLKDQDEEFDAKDAKIMTSDNLVIVGKTEDDISHLEVYVFDCAEEDLYVHHDIMLPSFPLCVEPINFSFGTEGSNFCAVGTFQSEIEIWNLDVTDVMYPHAILGTAEANEEKAGTGKKKKKKQLKLPNRHTGAIMGLSWNTKAKNFLASSSADSTVKLWDLDTLRCVHSYEHHTDKVAVVAFNPNEATVLATASYDKTICVLDARSPDKLNTWKTEVDVECLRWDPHNPHGFAVSFEDGTVRYYDCRNVSAPLFTLAAHSESVTALEFNPLCRDMLLTGASDLSVRLWDIKDMQPKMACSRDVGAGKVFTASFCPDSPYHVAVGGSLGVLSVWNITENAAVRQLFRNRMRFDKPGVIEVTSETIQDDEQADEKMEEEPQDDDKMEMEETIEEMKGAAGEYDQ